MVASSWISRSDSEDSIILGNGKRRLVAPPKPSDLGSASDKVQPSFGNGVFRCLGDFR